MATAITMQDFAMSAGCKRVMIVSPEFVSALTDFLGCFETVFGDADWPVTLDNMQSEFLIHPSGSFIEPGVADENANWWNRGSLLESYRRLLAAMDEKGFGAVEIHPCGAVMKMRPAKPAPTDDVI